MTAILATSAGLGGLVAGNLVAAVLAMGLVALCAGVWRHVSSDYGPGLAIASTLVFALGLGGHGEALAGRHFLAALAGGLWGLGLQVALWPFRPQHPLRRTVSDSWLSLSNVFAAMATEEPGEDRDQRIYQAESELRTTLDQTSHSLGAARAKAGALVGHLSELNRAAMQLATQLGAFNTVLESLMLRPDFSHFAASFQPVLTTFTNTCRTIALAVVSRQPSHLRTLDLRLRRLTNLLNALGDRIAARTGDSDESARMKEILGKMTQALPPIEASLRATIERANEREAFSLELFDMETWKLRPLASALNLSLRLDPALVRYSLRSAALTMMGVVAVFELHLHHGYWLPFTMMVVLQPDYGSTRQRAAQRVLGTVAGSVLASAILFLHLPAAYAILATAVTGFWFIYFVKRNYGVAVVFITLFVVLLTEFGGKVDIWFAVERLATTVAGGLLALLAALLFWPTWERDRFPPILARALRANGDFVRVVTAHILRGDAPDTETAHAQRSAEVANSAVFSSLRRLSGDPKNRQDIIERAAALANGNQRLTRALNGIVLHLEAGPPLEGSVLISEFSARASEALEALAVAAEKGDFQREQLDQIRSGLDRIEAQDPKIFGNGEDRQRLSWIIAQLGRASTELGAMLLV
jgi:uncharacterized membrane protein YccC